MGKFRNKIKSEFGKFLARYVYRGCMRTYPDVLVMEPTNRCSQICSCCPHGRDASSFRELHTMTRREFNIIIDNIDLPIRRVFLHLHGEPFLNSDLPYMAQRLMDRGVVEFNIFSNANFRDLSILEQMLSLTKSAKWNFAFSAEIHSIKSYEHLRKPMKFENLIKNLEYIDELMARYNHGYAINAILEGEFIDEARKNIQDNFKRLNKLDKISFSSRFPWPHLQSTGDLAGRLTHSRPICTQVSQLPVIMANGDVGMCNCDYRGETIIGNLLNTKYSELINCAAAKQFRLNLWLRHPERNGICGDCLIPRYHSFERTIARKFVLTASDENLKKYFDSYKKFFCHG